MNTGEKRRFSVLCKTLLLPVFISLLNYAVASGTGRDSVVSVTVEPGLTHLTILGDGPCVAHVLVVDLAAQNLRIESYRTVGLVPTSQQAKRNDGEGHKVVAAINADFFSFKTGWPVNNQVVNGQFVFGAPTGRSHLALNARGKPFIERIDFHGWVKPKSGIVYEIAGVNDIHRNNSIVLHNSYSDTATNFSGPGKTFLLKLVQTGWSVGDTLSMVVLRSVKVELEHILSDQAALWIGGGSSVWGARGEINVGDTLQLYLGIEPALKNIWTISGGYGMVLSSGKSVSDSVNLQEKMNPAFLTTRHPRTFVGFDRDTTKLYLCTVDGRQQSSVGMSFKEMADFLIPLGVWTAVNFDGGGSTTMVLDGSIVNSPSDATGERPVANSLQLIRVGPSPKR